MTEDTKNIALRFFRFRARRGIGVFYGTFSIFVIVSFFISITSNSLELLFIFWAIGGFGVWYASKLSGFRSFGRMRYAMALLENRKMKGSMIRSILNYNIVSFLRSFWPWIFFIALILLGYIEIAVLFPLIWVLQMALIWFRNFRKKGDVLLEFRLEDWAFLISLTIAAILVTVPKIGLMGFVYAEPVFIFSSIRSLFNAPMELLLGYETREFEE